METSSPRQIHPAAQSWLAAFHSAYSPAGSPADFDRLRDAGIALMHAEKQRGVLLARNEWGQIIDPETGRIVT